MSMEAPKEVFAFLCLRATFYNLNHLINNHIATYKKLALNSSMVFIIQHIFINQKHAESNQLS